MKKFLIISIFLLGLSLRSISLDNHPTGFTQDEASFGYDAYSILKTGKDQWGKSFPLALRSFGDFKLPLYSYLAIPSVAIFDLNIFSTRLPNAIFGSLAILAVYLMVQEMISFDKDGVKKYWLLPIFSAFLLAISPWHISLSRGAFEANLSTFFIPIGIYFYLKGFKNKIFNLLSALFLGLNLFSYHSARIFTPIIIVLVLYHFREDKKINLIKSIVLQITKNLGAFMLFSSFALIAFYSMFFGGAKRGSDILITNPTDHWMAVADRRYEAVLSGLPDSVSRLYSNKAVYTTKTFISNYLSYLSPQFLFTQGAGEWTYGMIPGRGTLYIIEIIFVTCAFLAYFSKSRFPGMNFIIFWFLLSPLSASITKGPGFAANRTSVMMPAIQILSAFGLLYFSEKFQVFYPKIKNNLIYLAIVAMLSISLFSFLEDYIYHEPVGGAMAMHYGVKELVEDVSSRENIYKEIRISRSLSVPNIFVAFYTKWDPTNYQQYSSDWYLYERMGHLYLDQLDGYKLGKYVFGSNDLNTLKDEDGVLIVNKAEEIPEKMETLKTIYFPNGKPAYKVIDSEILQKSL